MLKRVFGCFAVVAIAVAMHQPVAAGPNAKARLSLDLIPNGGAGNQRNDGVTSGSVSGRDTIAIEVFATGVTTPLIGMQLRFDFDASFVTFVKAENSAFAFNVPQPTGTDFAAFPGIRLASSGFLTRAEFTTATEVTGREFSIGLALVTLSESVASRDTLTTTNRISFNVPTPTTPTPDFDGDKMVGFSDFLAFVRHYGTRRGDDRYQAKYDLNSNGAIDFSDFLLFVRSYGTEGVGWETVEIPDPNLRVKISRALRKARITRADMATLRFIDARARYKKINDLTGLEFATNLLTLYLGSNQITDIAALSSLTNLRTLELNDNRISDLTALAGLTKLRDLHLDHNRISDLTALSSLTNLRELHLDHNPLSDITALAGLTNLTLLNLGANQITDITALAGLTNLTWLDLGVNQISDIAALAKLTNLTGLLLSKNQISDITALAGLTNLRTLNLGVNRISDITALAGLTKLEWLELVVNQISDITALAGLTNLIWLNLHTNQISDITALAGLTNLGGLVLSENQISDIAALLGLTNLYLNPDLTDLYLELRGNPLSATSINTHIPALRARGVEVNF